MHSPLPDSSALEAGILEDERPSRLSRVQDNVRNLLRTSMLGSLQTTTPPETPTRGPAGHENDGGMPPTPPETPTRTPIQPHHHGHQQGQPEVLPSPTSSLPSAASPTSSTASSASLISTPLPHHADIEAAGGLFPPPKYLTPLARMSALFTGRAIDALNHRDVSDPSLAVLARQKAEKRQRRAWKRRRNGAGRGTGREQGAEGGGSQCLLCVVAALMLGSIVATCKSTRRCFD